MFKEIKIGFLKRDVSVNVKSTNAFTRFTGLMFKNRETKNLIFEFSKETRTPIHSLFVFFPFLAVWLDSKNRVLEIKKVKPFRLSERPEIKFKKLVEIPINDKNRKVLQHLSRLWNDQSS